LPSRTKSVCTATFTGKNNITAVDRLTGSATSLGGNYQFQVDVTDKGETGPDGSTPADSYATRIWKDTGTYYVLGAYGANNTGTTNTAQVPIHGGNIRVKP
jgi:hypothetical protein